MPESLAKLAASTSSTTAPGTSAVTSQKDDEELSLERRAEEAFMIHMKYGGEYIDENPITGRPGDFHLSSTGRKPILPPKTGPSAGIGAMNGPTINTKVADDKKDAKADKTPKSATTMKPKRRKSKATGSVGNTPAAS